MFIDWFAPPSWQCWKKVKSIEHFNHRDFNISVFDSFYIARKHIHKISNFVLIMFATFAIVALSGFISLPASQPQFILCLCGTVAFSTIPLYVKHRLYQIKSLDSPYYEILEKLCPLPTDQTG